MLSFRPVNFGFTSLFCKGARDQIHICFTYLAFPAHNNVDVESLFSIELQYPFKGFAI